MQNTAMNFVLLTNYMFIFQKATSGIPFQQVKIMGPSSAKFLETATIAHVQCICVLCAHFLARSVFILIQATQQKKCPKRFF